LEILNRGLAAKLKENPPERRKMERGRVEGKDQE